jgi:hypothetical protein
VEGLHVERTVRDIMSLVSSPVIKLLNSY